MASQNGFLELLLSSLVYAWLFVNLLQVSSPFGTLALTVNCTSGFSRNGNECILLPPLLVENLAFGEVADTFVILTWEDPNPSGIVSHFRVIATLDCHIVVNKLTVNLSSNVTGLTSGTNYNFEVFAENAASKSFISNPKAPAAPFDVTVDQISANDITLSWNASVWNSTFPCTSSEYSIYYANLDTNGRELEEKVPGEQLSHNVNGLSPYTRYSFQIAFILGSGSIQGDRSPPIIAQTDQAVPTSPPRNISAIVTGFNLSISYILVSWHPPNQSEIPGVLSGFTLYARPADNFGVTYIENINGNETTTNYSLVLAVEPFTTYNITVSASTEAGEGPEGPIPPLTIERRCTSLRPGSPTNVAAESRGVDSLLITWDPPVETYGRILSYRVLVCGPSTCHTYAVDGATTTVLATSLDAPAFHHVFVFAQTGNGEGESACSAALTGQTVSAPSAPPQNASVVANSSTSFSVSWQRPPEMMRNGIIRMYIVRYNNTDDGKAANWTVGGDSLTALVTGLNEYSNYSVSVSAFTVAEGPSSSPIAVTTYEDVPSEPPRNFNVTPTCEGCIPSWLFLQWEPPPFDDQNGIIISYEIYYNGSEFDTDSHQINVSGDARSFTLKNLEQYVIYDVMIRAYTSVGPGPFSILTVRTLFERSLAPTIASVENISSTSLRVTWINPPLKDINGIYNGTEVQYSCGKTWCLVPFACHKECNGGMEFSQNMSEVSVLLTNLESYSCYFVSARFNTRNDAGQSLLGGSGSVYVTTAEDRPSGTISELTVADVLGEAELILDWNEINCTDINGLLHGYVIFFREANKSKASNVTIAPNATNFTLTNLTNFTMYYVWLQALNGAGRGPSSQVVQKRTDGNFLPPINVQAVALGPFAARMTWDPPAFGIRISGYRIQYMKADALNASFLDVNQTNLQETFDNLRPFRWYTFRVAAIREGELGKELIGPFSVEVRAKTLPSEPTTPARDVEVVSVGATSVVVQWKEPDPIGFNGILVNYRIAYSDLQMNFTLSNFTGDNDTFSFNVTNLSPHTLYEIKVYVYNTEGQGPPTNDTVQIKTGQAPPAIPPQNISATAVSSQSVQVMWSLFEESALPGILNGYNVYYQDEGHLEIRQKFISDPHRNMTTYILVDLRPFTLYAITMDAATGGGLGPEGPDPPLAIRTLQDVPGAPMNLTLTVLSSTSLNVSWEAPAKPNGIITAYFITFYDDYNSSYVSYKHLESKSTNFVLENLFPFRFYSVFVKAATVIGNGSRTLIQRSRTMEDAPSRPPNNLTVTRTCDECSPAELRVEWDPPPLPYRNGIIIGYEIYFIGREFDTDLRILNATGNATSKILRNLEEYVVYDVYILAYTSLGLSPLSPSESVRTFGAPPLSPSDVSVENVSSTALRILWTNPAPKDVNGIPLETEILYQCRFGKSCNCRLWSNDSDSGRITVAPNETETLLTGLHSYTWYTILIGSRNKDKETCQILSSNVVIKEILTVQDRPNGTVRHLVITQVKDKSDLLLTWQEPNCEEWNGVLQRYVIYFKEAGRNASEVSNVTISAIMTNYTLTNLTSYTLYAVWMQAFTSVGGGPFNDVVQNRTDGGVPPLIINVQAAALGPFSVRLTWDPPAFPTRISGYRIQFMEEPAFNASFLDVNQTQLEATFKNLKPFRWYTFKVAAKRDRELEENVLGPFSVEVTAKAHPSTPGVPLNLTLTVLSSSSINVSWEAPAEPNGIITAYFVTFYNHYDYVTVSRQLLGSNATNIVLETLFPFLFYSVYVQAATLIGNGSRTPTEQVRTMEDTPSRSPRNLTVSRLCSGCSPAQLRVQWDPPPVLYQNGVLQRYVIYFEEVDNHGSDSDSKASNVTVSSSATNFTLTNLKGFTLYSVRMQAFTSVGGGPLSEAVQERTSGDCNCFIPGSKSHICDNTTGQCLCNEGAKGLRCDTCLVSGRSFQNISECHAQIDYTPFNCLTPLSGWTQKCEDVALPSKPAAILHASATILAGDSLQRDHVTIYWNGWTCLFSCSLTYTWTVHQLVRQGSLLVTPSRHFFSHRLNHQPVVYPISVHLPPGINVIEVSATNERGISSVVRRLFLVDDHAGSKVMKAGEYPVQFPSADYGYWQTDQNSRTLSISWENHFYNTYIKKNPWLLFPVETVLTGFNIESPPLSFSGVKTFNHSGITSFTMDFYQKMNASSNVPITSENFTALTKEWTYNSPRHFVSGEWYEVNVKAWDIFGHAAVSGASVYMDFTPPSVTKVTVWQRNQRPIRDLASCSDTGTGSESVFTLEFTAVDTESGIENVDWTIGKSNGTIRPQTQFICSESDESCYCATDGVCILKTYTARIDNAAQLTGRFNVKIQAKSRSGLTNTTEQEVETRRAEGAAPELKTIDIVSSRSLRVSWTFSATAETFLVITCRKHLVEGRCVSCSEVSTPGKDKSVVVQNLRPATKYRIQIQAVLSDRSALSGTDQAILTEDVPERAPIDVIVSVLPGKQALVTWNLPELFYRNGIITGYVLEVEIEDALGRWVLAQAKITISSPKTNSTVENLNSGRKYRMSVAAATKIGLGPLSDPKEITTPEDVPDEPPTNVSLSLAETNSFRISWEGIPENGQNGVLRQYRIAYSPQNGKEAKKEVTVRATESSVMLTGLSPFTLYIVNVAGETSIGKGPFSGDILVRTSEDIPGPPSLGRIDALGATSISVSWIAPTEPRGLIQGYMVVAESSPLVGRRRRAVDPVSVAYFFAKSDESFKDLSNLSEASNYTIYVQANTSKGYGEKSKTSSIVTPKRIPGAPRDLNAVPRSSASIAVSWQAPSQGSPAIYLVSYLAVDPPGPKQNRTTTTPSVQINLLFPNTYYRIEVKAKDGNASSITFARTFEGVPGPLASFRVPEVSASSVLLEWEPPEAPNGRIGFAYVITNLATGISTTVKLQPDELGSLINNFFRWRVAELNGFTEYRFIMLAFNIRHDSNGEASDAQVVRTDQGKPGPPADVRVESTRRSSLLVSWSPPEKPNGIVTTYEVITRWANETGTPATFTVIHRNNPTARFQEVFGLEHPALYGVVIRAKTISGEGAGSKIIYRRTKFEDPNDRTPRNVTYSNFTSTDVTVMWVEPGQTTGLWNYTLKVFKDGFTPFGTPIFLDRNSTAVVVKNLTPYTLFSFEIVAGYNDGTLGDISDPLYVQTESSAPSSPPRNFTVESDNSSTILLNWISPPLSDLNGVLCGFVVRYWPSGSIAEIFKEEFSPEEHHGSLTELKPYTEYVVTVAAETCNARGEGPAASGQNRTQEGVPERPSVSVIARNSTWIRIRWTVIPNGVLSRIEVNFSSVDNNVSKSSNLTSGEVEFNDLQPYHIYTVRLRGYSGGGGGDVEVKNVTTCPAAPIGFPLIQRCETFKHGDNENGFRLDWTDVLERQWRGIPEDYHVFLNPGNSSESVDVNAPNWTLPYQKQANGSILSRTFILDTSVEANRWYTVTMAAKTMADDTLPICHDDDSFIGPANSTCKFYLHPPVPSTSTPTTIGPTPPILLLATVIPVCVLVVVLALLIICWCRYKRTRQGKADLEFINLQQMRQRGLYAADGDLHWLMTWPTYDKYQFPRDRLKVEGELGEGQFGKVYLAWAVGLVKDEERTHVAVKTMKRGSSRETAEDFRKEMEIMMDFDHPNIVRLLGVCTREEPLYLITELMEHGDLKDFIRKARASELQPRPQLSLQELIDIASQAAAGVAYLASSKFVHRDIAGRNCLVGRNKDDSLVVKISDFGMARDVYQDEYYRRKGGALPIRWMAPEAITDGKYTVESDVWSLGVLLWETFSFGYQPYFGQDNEKVIGGVIGGTLCLQCPPLCPESVYYLMKRCWERSPAERISAEEVADSLEEMLHLSKEESQGDYGLVLDRKYQFSLKNRKPRETSLSYLDMSSAEGNPPPSSVPEYIPMSPGTPAGTKLGIQFEEDPLLPNASEGYLDMKPSTVSKLEPAKSTRRNEYVPDPVQVNDGKFDAEVKTEEIDAGYQDGEAFENPGYCSVPNGKEPITYL